MFLKQIQETLDKLELDSKLNCCEDQICLPNRKEVVDLIKDLQSLLFPDFFKSRSVTQEGLGGISLLRKIRNELETLIEKTSRFADHEEEAEAIADAFLSRLPEIKALLLKDIDAIYE